MSRVYAFLAAATAALAFVAPIDVFAAAAAPETLWVDRENGDDDYAGDDKGSEDHPFASIQAAIDAASDGYTIKVLPGDYDNGGYVDDLGHSNRVYIAKKIHLVSTEGAWQTTIRGKFDSGDTANDGTNLARDGVRCVYVLNSDNKKNGYGAVVEGFTLVDGYAAEAHGFGGAIRTKDVNVGAYFVDCTITNCTGTMKSAGSNGAIRGGTLVRCEVLNCVAWSTLYVAKAWNCVFSGNTGIRGVLASSTAVNCSFYGNDTMDYLSFQPCTLVNCAATCYPRTAKHHNATILNSTDNRAGVFVDPANYDWTLTADSPAVGIADATALTNVIKLTEAAFPIDLVDFYWNPLPTEGVINAGAVQDVRPAVTWWVDRARGNDDYVGADLGDTNHPFASIQAAVENAVDGDTIKVLPGDYDNGGYVDDKGHTNRVYITKRLHLVSTGGAAATTIRGKHDTGDTALNGTNLAGDGARCVRAVTSTNVNSKTFYKTYAHGTVIEGFTLADGYATSAHGYGGAFKIEQQQYGVFLVDCVVTNCTGTSILADSNGVIVGGSLVRCAVLNSPESWAVIVASRAWNFVFSGNVTINGRGLLARSQIVNCSLANNDGSNIHYGSANTGGLYGLVSVGARPTSYYNASVPVVNSLKGLSSAFVDSANGDWRLLPGSAAIGLADAADYTNAVDFSDAACPIAFTDFHGNEMPTEGVINAGASQTVAPRLYAASPKFGGATVTGCELDVTNFVALSGAPTIEVTISPSTAMRSLVAVVTNGVEVPISAAPAAFTVVPSEANGALTTIEWVYRPDWYVNEKTGSDSNDGFTPETPFATLAAACTNAMLIAGDVIHVAEGEYSTGIVAPASGKTIGARAYVKSGVALVADGAKEKTLIIGAEATGDDIEEAKYNSGFNAVRCVYLEDNATVCGFTICGGRTRAYGSGAQSSNIDFDGGGACGPNSTLSLHATRIVEDCVITNCVAAWGGGAYGVILRRCLVKSCGATRLGPCSYYTSHESCYIRNSSMFYPYAIVNSTVYMDAGLGACYSNDLYVPTNCLFLAKLSISQYSTNAVNCIFQKHTSTGRILLPSDLPHGSTSTFVDTIASLNLDSDYRPSKTSKVVDFSPQLGVLTSDKDFDGNPRVLNNGRVDCGCYEYDWRKDYTADIGARGLTVDAAAPDVVETNGVVRLVGGSDVVISWVFRSASRRTFPVVVSGAGTLAAYVNGALVAELTSADSSFSWEGAAGTDEIRLVFSGEGYAELGTPVNASGLILLIM